MRGYRADAAFDGGRMLPGGALVLVDEGTGTIAAIEPGTAPAPDGCPVTHLAGTTLLPGLIDTHTHLCGNSAADALDRIPALTADELDGVITAALRAQLAAGVTTVRDLGDHRWAVVDRHRNTGGGPPLPTVLGAGPPITSRRGHCWSMGGEVSGADELRRAVRERADRGADVVKVMASGGLMTATTDVLATQFTVDELRLAVAEAHRLGLRLTAHAHAQAAVEQCLDAGVDGIEHCSCLTAGGMHTPPELVERLAAAGTAVCPTLGCFGGGTILRVPRIQAALDRLGITRQAHLDQAGRLYRGGVTLVAGADSGIGPTKPHGMVADVVTDLVTAGVPVPAALAAATGTAADVCGLGARKGRLRAGLDADLLLVDGDPTTDIGAVHRVRAVVARGRDV